MSGERSAPSTSGSNRNHELGCERLRYPREPLALRCRVRLTLRGWRCCGEITQTLRFAQGVKEGRKALKSTGFLLL